MLVIQQDAYSKRGMVSHRWTPDMTCRTEAQIQVLGCVGLLDVDFLESIMSVDILHIYSKSVDRTASFSGRNPKTCHIHD